MICYWIFVSLELFYEVLKFHRRAKTAHFVRFSIVFCGLYILASLGGFRLKKRKSPFVPHGLEYGLPSVVPFVPLRPSSRLAGSILGTVPRQLCRDRAENRTITPSRSAPRPLHTVTPSLVGATSVITPLPLNQQYNGSDTSPVLDWFWRLAV